MTATTIEDRSGFLFLSRFVSLKYSSIEKIRMNKKRGRMEKKKKNSKKTLQMKPYLTELEED